MKYLITGGAGFIGSNFISFIFTKYPDAIVICVDSLTYAGNVMNFDGYDKKRFIFEYADICDRDRIFDIVGKHRPDYIINFAAESHVDRAITDPTPFVRTNFLGTANLLDAAREFNISRFHQISTDEVYGDIEDPYQSREEDVLHPSSPYSASKASADLLVLSYYRTYGLPVTVSRCSNNYGPRQFPEKLIPLSVCYILRRKPVQLYGDGFQRRDWIYVVDHCRAIDLIINSGRVGEIYNIGSSDTHINLETVKLIFDAMASDCNVEYITDRPGHDRRYALDCNKIFNELGWSPSTPFEDGIKASVRWYLNNREWLDAINNKSYLEINKHYK